MSHQCERTKRTMLSAASSSSPLLLVASLCSVRSDASPVRRVRSLLAPKEPRADFKLKLRTRRLPSRLQAKQFTPQSSCRKLSLRENVNITYIYINTRMPLGKAGKAGKACIKFTSSRQEMGSSFGFICQVPVAHFIR